MGITINLFKQEFIDGALEILKPPSTFLRDTFIGAAPVTPEVDSIIIDIVVEGQKMSALVSSDDDPIRIGRKGYSSNQVSTPKVHEIMELKPRDFMDHRQPGQVGITATSDPKFRKKVEDEITKMLKEAKDRRVRLEEYQMAQAALYGKWTVTLPNGKKYSIDFQRPSTHSYALTGGDKWDAPTTSNPLAMIKTKAKLIVRGCGSQATTIVMNSTTEEYLLLSEKFKADMNSKNQYRGYVDTTQAQLQSGAKQFAKLDGFEFFEYDATYEDYAGATQLYIPDGYVIIGAKQFAGNKPYYGPIEDFDAMPDVRRQEFSKNWLQKMPSKWLLSYESHPLIATHKPESFVALKVY